MKVPPALFEGEGEGEGGGGRGEGEGQIKLRNTFQRLRPEEFSSGDFGLSSFRQPEISTWAEISDISGRKLRIFQRQCWAQGRWRWRGRGRGGQNLNEI